MTMILTIAGAIVVLGGGIAVLRKGFRAWRKVSNFIDAVVGVPEQFGLPARPGVLERMSTHEDLLNGVIHELHPNSGTSLRDVVDRTEKQLADHIAACPPPVQVNVTGAAVHPPAADQH